jgi:hypothetical protein
MSTKQSHKRRGTGRPAERRPIKVTPRRKADIDPHMISLVYYLIASRLVREAKEAEAASEHASVTSEDLTEPMTPPAAETRP